MNYIYDIILNFNRDYYDFFEWKKKDKIINVKKIPVFKVSDEDFRNFKYNNIRVDNEFLDKICDLTYFYHKMDNSYRYMCLVSNANGAIGLMFDRNGNLIKRSSLVFDEEDEVNEEVLKEEVTVINYKKNEFKEIDFISRIEKEKKEYLFKFISNLDVYNDSNILKYIYYDYFEKESDNIFEIKKILIDEINNNYVNMNNLFDLVRVLKKIKN